MGINTKKFKQSSETRKYRRFSDSFKRSKVREIESGKATVRQVCKAYEVSDVSVYKWLEKFSNKSKPERTIVESKSDTQKILALQKKIADLERALGQKQLEVEFKDKMIDIAESVYGIEIKKNSETKR